MKILPVFIALFLICLIPAAYAEHPIAITEISIDGKFVPYTNGMNVTADNIKIKGTSNGITILILTDNHNLVGVHTVNSDGTWEREIENPRSGEHVIRAFSDSHTTELGIINVIPTVGISTNLQLTLDDITKRLLFLERVVSANHISLNIQVAEVKNVIGYGHIIKVENMNHLGDVEFSLYDDTNLNFVTNTTANDDMFGYFVLPHDTVGTYTVRATDGIHDVALPVSLLADPPRSENIEVSTEKIGNQWFVTVNGTGFDVRSEDHNIFVHYTNAFTNYILFDSSFENIGGNFTITKEVYFDYIESGEYYIEVNLNEEKYIFHEYLEFDTYPENIIEWEFGPEVENCQRLSIERMHARCDYTISGNVDIPNTQDGIVWVHIFNIDDEPARFLQENAIHKDEFVDERIPIINNIGDFSSIFYDDVQGGIHEVEINFQGITRYGNFTTSIFN